MSENRVLQTLIHWSSTIIGIVVYVTLFMSVANFMDTVNIYDQVGISLSRSWGDKALADWPTVTDIMAWSTSAASDFV